jgi:uncharacterized membrane protein YeaQ/YmgE (transglycosylase-associated protein family)
MGGITPLTGFHSVIDRPEPVSRVAPPTITMHSTTKATANSQMATGRERSDRRNEVIGSSYPEKGPYCGHAPARFTLSLSRRIAKRSWWRKGDLLDGVGLFDIALIGLFAGVAANLLLGRRCSVFAALLLGLAGAFVGELAAQALDIPHAGSFVGVLIAALIGAALMLGLLSLPRRRPKP